MQLDVMKLKPGLGAFYAILRVNRMDLVNSSQAMKRIALLLDWLMYFIAAGVDTNDIFHQHVDLLR